jgi:hypothetical protein
LVKALDMHDVENPKQAQEIVGQHTENARLRAIEKYKHILYLLENTKGR